MRLLLSPTRASSIQTPAAPPDSVVSPLNPAGSVTNKRTAKDARQHRRTYEICMCDHVQTETCGCETATEPLHATLEHFHFQPVQKKKNVVPHFLSVFVSHTRTCAQHCHSSLVSVRPPRACHKHASCKYYIYIYITRRRVRRPLPGSV